jgi:hypothetical protein
LRAEDETLNHAYALPFDGPRKVTTAMVGKAMALVPRYKDDALRAKFEEAVRMTHDDNATVAHGLKLSRSRVSLVR